MRIVLPLLLSLLLIFAACTGELAIDGTSPTSADATISEVRASLDEDDRRDFDHAFELIVRAEIHSNLEDLDGEGAEDLVIGYVIERVDGLTGHEVIELGNEISRVMHAPGQKNTEEAQLYQ